MVCYEEFVVGVTREMMYACGHCLHVGRESRLRRPRRKRISRAGLSQVPLLPGAQPPGATEFPHAAGRLRRRDTQPVAYTTLQPAEMMGEEQVTEYQQVQVEDYHMGILTWRQRWRPPLAFRAWVSRRRRERRGPRAMLRRTGAVLDDAAEEALKLFREGKEALQEDAEQPLPRRRP